MEVSNCIPLRKKHPPDTVEIEFRPISRAPILANVVESFVLQWVDRCVNAILMHLQFQNAFDKKPHEILLLNLKRNGIGTLERVVHSPTGNLLT